MAIDKFIAVDRLGDKYVAPTPYSPVVPEDKRPGQPRPGVSSGGGGGSPKPSTQVIKTDPRLGRSVSDVIGESSGELKKARDYIEEVESRTGESFADVIAKQGQKTDFGTSELLSRIAQKKFDEKIASEIKEPLEAYESKAEAFAKDVKEFEEKYTGRSLPSGTFAEAQRKQSELLARQKELESQASKLQFAERVATIKAQQEFKQQQDRLNLQVSGSAKIQDLIRSGAGKQTDTIISDSKTPIIVKQNELFKKTSKIPEIPVTKIEAPKSIVEEQDIRDKMNRSQELLKTEKSLVEKLSQDQLLSQGDIKVLAPSIEKSRRVLAGQLTATADAVLLAAPFSLITKVPGVARIASGIGRGVRTVSASKTAKVIGETGVVQKLGEFVKPTIRFTRYSDLVQTGAISGKRFVVEGKGKILYEEAGLISKIKSSITRQPLKFVPKEQVVGFSLETSKKFGLKAVGKTKLSPTGAPTTLQGLIPKERLASLLKEQFFTTKALKGRAGFETKGFLRIGEGSSKDVRLVKEFVDAYTKKVKVGTSPIGISGTGTSFKFRLLNVGEDAVSSARVRGGITPMLKGSKATAIDLERKTGQIVSVKKDGLVSRFVQKTRTDAGGPKFNIFSEFVEGKARSPFDFGRVRASGKRTKVEPAPKKIIGKPITAKDKVMFKTITQKSFKEGKWAFKPPKLNVNDFLKAKELVSKKPVESVFKLSKPDSPDLKIYKLIKGQLRRINKPVKPGVFDKKSKELFNYLSADKTPSLFKLKRKEVKAIDLIKKPITAKDKELFKFLSDNVKKESGEQLTTIGKVITKASTKTTTKIPDALKVSSSQAISKELVKSLKEKSVKKSLRKTGEVSRLGLLQSFGNDEEDVEILQVVPDRYSMPLVSSRSQQQERTVFQVQPVNLEKVRVGEITRSLDKVKIGSVSKTKSLQAVRFDQSSKVLQDTRVLQSQQSKIAQAVKVAQAKKLSQALKTRTATMTRLKQVTPVRTTLKTPTPRVPIPPILIPPIGFKLGNFVSKKKKKGLVELFDVEVKRKGKFVRVGKALPKGIATIKGKTIVGETAARTFKLTPVGVGKKRDVQRDIDLSRFRSPKGKTSLGNGLVFVEKAKFAISSPGEKREIPGKAALLKRSKSFKIFG